MSNTGSKNAQEQLYTHYNAYIVAHIRWRPKIYIYCHATLKSMFYTSRHWPTYAHTHTYSYTYTTLHAFHFIIVHKTFMTPNRHFRHVGVHQLSWGCQRQQADSSRTSPATTTVHNKCEYVIGSCRRLLVLRTRGFYSHGMALTANYTFLFYGCMRACVRSLLLGAHIHTALSGIIVHSLFHMKFEYFYCAF